MGKYRLIISNTAQKSLHKLPKKDLLHVLRVLETLAINPYPAGCRKLSGEEHVFRIRIGRYRVIYEIDGDELIVWVLKIGHRKDVYR